MPKATAYRLAWSRERDIYEVSESQRELPLVPESDQWFAWLATIPSFTFRGKSGHLTVRQERMRRGGMYWYAYRRDGEKMRKHYLGRTSKLTLAHLEEVAAHLSLPRPSPQPVAHASSDEARFPQPPPPGVALFKSEAMATLMAPPDPADGWGLLQFGTKVHRPRLRAHLVRRPHLIDQLRQGLNATLILVSAPAGFGKTTLLTQWLAESEMSAAWLSLEPEDNEPMRFLSALTAAFQQLHPQIGTGAQALLQMSAPIPPPAPEAVLALLAADVRKLLPGEITLVLDDYHVVTNGSVQHAVATLVEHAPPHLHLVIATRADPALPLARLRARGQLCEVRATHLQFRAEEVEAFLHMVMGLTLSVEAVASLGRRTEGWITGLQLAALSLQGRADVPHFLEEFTGNHRHLVDYLTEEVLACQSEAVQSFLLQTSLLDRFSASLCDAITGRVDSETMLKVLEQANLFLVPLDERREWYRYHQLFAEMLRARARRVLGEDGVAALYTQASRWYEQHGTLFDAVETALSAADFARAERLIEPLAALMARDQQHVPLQRWLERLPRERLFSHGLLCFAYAFLLFHSEMPEAHTGPLATAERLFQAQGDRKGLGQTSMLRAMAANAREESAQTITFGTQALELLPEDALLERCASSLALANGYAHSGQITAAQRVLATVHPMYERYGNRPFVLRKIETLLLGRLLLMQGRLGQAEKTYASLLEETDVWPAIAAQSHLAQGMIGWERNELDETETHLEQALALARRTRDLVVQVRIALLQAQVAQAHGESERTAATFLHAQGLAEQCHVIGLVEQVQALQVRAWLRQGHMEAVSRWQEKASLSGDTAPTYEQETIALTWVHVLLAQGKAEEALRMLARWRQHASAQGRTGSEMEMLILAALAYQRQGKTEQAMQLLQQALILGYPEGHVRLFAEQGPPMATLLRLTLSRWKSPPEASYLHTLLTVGEAALPEQRSLSGTIASAHPSLEPLSRREREVLRLLAADLSTAEIADELVVSINTVRTHIRSLYHKLQVNSRKEALATARHWKLL